MKNQVEAVLAAEVKQAINQAFATLNASMPFLKNVPASEKQGMQILADGRRPFVAKAIEVAQTIPDANPGAVLVEGAEKDLNLFNDLETIERELRRLTEMVSDTRALAGAEAYEFARIVYKKVKLSDAMGAPGMKTLIDDLGRLYKLSPRESAPASPE